jgi:hypothetical protein
MAKSSAFTLKKSEDTYHIYHKGYPIGGLLRFHCSLGVAAALLAVPTAVELSPRMSQAYFVAAALLLLYALCGYLIYVPFAALSGHVSFTPKQESIQFSKALLGKDTELARQIPWEGKLDTEVEEVGLKVKLLPLCFYRVKVVTDFMTYHVATFAPGMQKAAEDLGKAVKRARYGNPSASGRYPTLDVESLKIKEI